MRASRVTAVSRLLWKGSARQNLKLKEGMVKRTATKITVEGINFKPPTDGIKKKGVKESGAWRYPNGVIQRAPSVRLGSNDYTDPKDPGEPRRKHESNFFITLNTNRKIDDTMPGAMAEEGKNACKFALDLLSKDESMCTYIKFGPKDKTYHNDIFEEVIFKVEWQAAVEVGENLSRLHCHIWLTLHHYSQVQVNMPVMQRMFKEAYNSYGEISTLYGSKLRQNGLPYIQVKLLPSSDWAMVMKQYIHKGMASA